MVVIFLEGEGRREAWWLVFQIYVFIVLLWQRIIFVSLKFFFSDKIILEFCLYEEFTYSFLSCALPKERGDQEIEFLEIMRCHIHFFIQSLINSGDLISRLFALVAASSRGVAVSAQAVRGRSDLIRSDVLSYHLWGILVIKVFYTDSALVVSQISYSIHSYSIQATLWWVFLLALERHSGWSSYRKWSDQAGTRTLQRVTTVPAGEKCVFLIIPIVTSASPPPGKTLSKVRWVYDFFVSSSSRIGLFMAVHLLRFFSGVFPYENMGSCLRNLSYAELHWSGGFAIPGRVPKVCGYGSWAAGLMAGLWS